MFTANQDGAHFPIDGCSMWHGHLAHVWRSLQPTGETPVPLSARFAINRKCFQRMESFDAREVNV
jgi:hypothetical protein